MPRTSKQINASRHNVKRAQMSRVRTRQPRSPARTRPLRSR